MSFHFKTIYSIKYLQSHPQNFIIKFKNLPNNQFFFYENKIIIITIHVKEKKQKILICKSF